ncbi:MAG: 1-acyl-sn-glycerol-3-phosphate acyltransferase [Nitriliruptoraceae bacterium]|nr:1-acyl-sn-glycerol-3-phosphate acyltransferase [Nitriliruptoraceae bacterium]
MANPVYASIIGACITSFQLLRWKVDVQGSQYIPPIGGAVIATNHVGYLDFVFSGYGVREQGKRRLRFVAKREVFDHPVTGPLMRAMGHVPVDRGGNTGAALAEVARNLQAGELVGMFPEGTISTSFVPLAGRPGAVRMAMDAEVPLIPGAVWGTQRIFTKGRKVRPAVGTHITVRFGPAVSYRADEDAIDVHERLMGAIGALVDEAQRTYPQRPEDDADRWWLPAHLGGTAPTPDEARLVAEQEAAERRARRRGSSASGTTPSSSAAADADDADDAGPSAPA